MPSYLVLLSGWIWFGQGQLHWIFTGIAALQIYTIISSFTLWLNLIWKIAVLLNIYWDSSTTNIHNHIQFYSMVEFIWPIASLLNICWDSSTTKYTINPIPLCGWILFGQKQFYWIFTGRSSTTNECQHIEFYSLVEFDLAKGNFTECLLG